MNNVSQKQKFFWNMMGSLANAFSSLILSICVNRILGGSSGGLFAFAYSNAQLMLTIGIFETRTFQSTDIREKYSFNTYFVFRLITCFFAIIATVVYIFINEFSAEKSIVVLVLVLFKMVEAFTDVYGGRFQQKDRIDLSGKTFFIRVAFSTLIFIILLVICNNLVIASVGMFLTSFLLIWIYDYKFVDKQERGCFKVEYKKVLSLFVEVFPLFICSFIMMYITNAPKYGLNKMYMDDIQNIYGILSMPIFVINLFSLFVFRPLLIRLSSYWNEKKIGKLLKIILYMYLCIGLITFVALIATSIIGIPVLSILYNINLDNYKLELLILMFIGGLSAIMTFNINIITIMRQSKWLLLASCIVFLYDILCADWIIAKYEIMGAIISYGIAVSLLVFFYSLIIAFTIAYERRYYG